MSIENDIQDNITNLVKRNFISTKNAKYSTLELEVLLDLFQNKSDNIDDNNQNKKILGQIEWSFLNICEKRNMNLTIPINDYKHLKKLIESLTVKKNNIVKLYNYIIEYILFCVVFVIMWVIFYMAKSSADNMYKNSKGEIYQLMCLGIFAVSMFILFQNHPIKFMLSCGFIALFAPVIACVIIGTIAFGWACYHIDKLCNEYPLLCKICKDVEIDDF